MASKVKVATSDIKSQKHKTLLINIVKHVFSNLVLKEEYQSIINDPKQEYADIMKSNNFKKELTFNVTNQLIKAELEHYVVVLGQEFILQVKYKSGSMIRFEILNYSLLLYEVPYICVPSLKDNDMLTDKEYEEIQEKNEDKITVKTSQLQILEDKYEGYDKKLEKALKETLVWYQQAKAEDQRKDKLAGMLLSRMYSKINDYQWHIIFGQFTQVGSQVGKICNSHQVRQKKETAKPKSEIKLNFYVKLQAEFQYMNQKTGKVSTKQVEVIVFNQRNNPQTSVQSIFGGLRDFNIKKLFTLNSLTIMAFLCILLVFLIPKGLCSGYKEKQALHQLDRIDSDQVIQDDDQNLSNGIVNFICSKQDNVVTNLGVSFLLLTVIRQIFTRINAKKDRVK